MRPFFLLVIAGWVAVALASQLSATAPGGQTSARVVNVSAERFSFTPSEIRTKAGEPIEIRLRSEDTDHGFRILDTDVDVRIPKRGKGTVTATFRPAREGRYTFECSHVCGAGHGFMRGTIVVTK
ncbi:MAG TPA: cupredoxin domain-containing protein [Vicinamibacterales bacterium]|nr:cupredoxin domain-containing protein [Vicinamibacterales bacterium]